MGNVAQNVRNVKELIQQVRLHPACHKVHDDGSCVTFWTASNTRQPRQVRYGYCKGEGKAWAYTLVLEWLNMEQQA